MQVRRLAVAGFIALCPPLNQRGGPRSGALGLPDAPPQVNPFAKAQREAKQQKQTDLF